MKKHRIRVAAVAVGVAALVGGGQQAAQANYGPTTGGFFVGGAGNFGYKDRAVRCDYFYRAGPRDLGVFDSLQPSNSNTFPWTQRFVGKIPSGFRTAILTIQVREVFSDNTDSTLTIDGITRPLLQPGNTPSECGQPMVRTIILTGADAAVADDGVLHMIFRYNGDAVALDWSAVTVTDAAGVSYGGPEF